MRLKVESSSKDAKKLKDKFVALASSVESENWESGEISLVIEIVYILLQNLFIKCNIFCFLDFTYRSWKL